MGILSKLKPHNGPVLTLDFPVVGIEYHEKDFKKLLREDPFYNTVTTDDWHGKLLKVTRYDITTGPVKLVPDPKNKADKNAVKVLINGKHIGYVPRSDNKQVLNILNACLVTDITATASGGPYKVVAKNDITALSDDFTVKIQISYKQ